MQKYKVLFSALLLNGLVLSAWADSEFSKYSVKPDDVFKAKSLLDNDLNFGNYNYGLNSNGFANKWLQGLLESNSCGTSSLETYADYTATKFKSQGPGLLSILASVRRASNMLGDKSILDQRSVEYNVTAETQRAKVNTLKINKALYQDRLFEILKLGDYIEEDKLVDVRVSDGVMNVDFQVRQYMDRGENAVILGGDLIDGVRIKVSESGLKKVTSLIASIKKVEEDIAAQTKFLGFTEEIEKMQKAEASLFPSTTESTAAIAALDNYRTTLNTCKMSLPVGEASDLKGHTILPARTQNRGGHGPLEFGANE